jgi:hypothetical protein
MPESFGVVLAAVSPRAKPLSLPPTHQGDSPMNEATKMLRLQILKEARRQYTEAKKLEHVTEAEAMVYTLKLAECETMLEETTRGQTPVEAFHKGMQAAERV